MKIDVCFLGRPEVRIDGVSVNLEQKKFWALLLYVLYNGSATRDELAEFLWCDYAEESARRNLRNSLYMLKAAIGANVLETKGHSVVRVSPKAIVQKDIDVFIMEDNDVQMLSLKSYIFLDHFYIRSCPEFDAWVSGIRSAYEKLAIRKFINALRRSISKHAAQQIEDCAQHILAIDPYNEEAGRALMRVYIAREEWNAASAFYRELEHRIEEELGVAPEAETRKLYEDIGNLKKATQAMLSTRGTKIYHPGAVGSLDHEYQAFLQGANCHHCILTGNIGMGKSETIEQFLESRKIRDLIELDFQFSDRGLMYYGAERLSEKLQKINDEEEIKPIGQNAIALHYIKVLERLLEQMRRSGKRCVAVLRNIEALDKASADILASCFFGKAPEAVWIIGEYCPSFETQPSMVERLCSLPATRRIDFPLLSSEEGEKYLYDKITSHHRKDEVIRKGVNFAGGNLLLLREYIHNLEMGCDDPEVLSQKGTRILNQLISSLSPEEHSLVELLAVLGRAEVEDVAAISQETTTSVIRSMSGLFQRGWVCEKKEGQHLLLHLRFGLLRKQMQSKMPEFKAQALHRLSAEYFEKKLNENSQDLYYLTQVKDHYSQTFHLQKKIYYSIKHLEYVLDYYDEFFPTITDEGLLHGEDISMSRKEIYQAFHKYNEYLIEAEDRIPPDLFYEMRIKLDFLEGRARIRNGEREKGVVLIYRMIELAKKLGRDDILMKGYVEVLCYTVRAENFTLMEKYIGLAYRIKEFQGYEREHGIILRLQGYLMFMREKYEDAERYLKQSVQIFEQPKLLGTNFFNLAAAYDYLAINSRMQEKYDEALEYIHRAISICTEKEVQKSLDVFYADCGYILFLKKDYDRAEKYFLQSIELYERFETYWLRSVAESGLSMIYALQGNRKLALEHFRQAEVFSQKERAMEEIEMLQQARELLRQTNVL